MTKQDLIDHIADSMGITKAEAGRFLECFVGGITDSLVKGQNVVITGFGTFKVSPRAARDGRNPQTGETIRIAASIAAGFKPGKSLKDAVNGRT